MAEGAESKVDAARLDRAWHTVREALLAEAAPAGHWVGELSSSATATAAAIVALTTISHERYAELVAPGLRWLAAHVNADGGWGDTVRSRSDLAATAMAWAAFGAARADEEHGEIARRAGEWLARATQAPDSGEAASPAPAAMLRALDQRYAADRTFVVSLLVALALSGRFGANPWEHIPALPFELAALPRQFLGALSLPVASYGVAALIASGQAVHHHHPAPKRLPRWGRTVARSGTLRVLTSMQAASGGFLESIMLASFVTMSLGAIGLANHVAARKGAEFIEAAMRADGSWPLATNLATRATTMAIEALSHEPNAFAPELRLGLREWLLGQQQRRLSAFTSSPPGRWSWTDLPGGAPHAEDTARALLALLRLGVVDGRKRTAGLAGCRWLMSLQNRDGGIPAFARGWKAVPADRSGADQTALAVRAWGGWRIHWKKAERHQLNQAVDRALHFLAESQLPNGSWLPIWFLNEHAPEEANPLYGTAQAVIALREIEAQGATTPPGPLARGTAWIAAAQNEDSGWGGASGAPSSVEETALAIEALAGSAEAAAVEGGVRWLVERVESGAWREPSAIGLHFGGLHYAERLYPLIWTAGALGKVAAAGLRTASAH